MKKFDIAIIGAGIVGCAIARELSKYSLSVALIEKNDDVGAGTTKANSGIVHGGYDAKHGTLKAQLCATGNALYQQLDDELHFGFKRIGAFIIGFDEEDEIKLQQLYENGLKNGVDSLKLVDGDFVCEKEPHLNKDIKTALYCKTVGVTSPYNFAVALTENAIENGVELFLNKPVTQIVKTDLGFEISSDREKFISKLVINAAGLYADVIAQMVEDHSFVIKPRRGQYLLFDKDQNKLVNHVIFQTPTKKGKGVLVTNTVHGNLLVGPNAQYIEEKDDLNTTVDAMQYVIETARKSLPGFDMRKVITSFAGNRASSDRKDFIIEESKQAKGFIHVAGIESPGLTAAPAIANYVLELIKALKRCDFQYKADFNPHRKPAHQVAEMSPEELKVFIETEPQYGQVVCRCETISEGEIVDVLKRNIPIDSLDAIKRRTRCGMGRCQGGFCTPKVMDIMSETLQVSKQTIGKKGKGSELLVGRTKRAFKTKDK